MLNNQLLYNVPGKIVTFDAAKQQATVQVCVELVYSDSGETAKMLVTKPIKGIPVHINSGGGWAQTHPIAVGDTCQVSFSQVGYDHWLYENKVSAGTLDEIPKPWLRRKFNRNDGFCLVGYHTEPLAITSYSDTHSEWRNAAADQIIRLKDDQDIEIETTTKVLITAPLVDVQCDDAVVNATNSIDADCVTLTVDATTSATVTTPTLAIIAATAVNMTTPLFTLTGAMSITETLLVAKGIGAGGAPAGATGAAIVGPVTITGITAITGALTATTVASATQTLDGHVHSGNLGNPTSVPS